MFAPSNSTYNLNTPNYFMINQYDRFSKRTNWKKTANPLSKTLKNLRRESISILDLTVSNPTQLGFKFSDLSLLDGLKHSDNLRYVPDPHGLPTARQSILEYYRSKGIHLKTEQIFITPNTSEAYSFIFRLLTDPGDAILAPQPSYPLLDYLTSLHDLETLRYTLNEKQDWKINFESFAAAKALLLVHPNNPTGSYVSMEERSQVNAWTKKHGTSLIVDEVFLDYPLHDSKKCDQSFAGNKEILTFTLSGVSKVLALPQMKLSWIIVSGPKEVRDEAIERLEIISDTYLSASTPIQNALPGWMKKKSVIQEEITTRIRNNQKTVREILGNLPEVFIPEVQGGWSMPIQFPSSLGDEEWALKILKETHVLFHPGYLYDFQERSWLVLSLITPNEALRQRLSLIVNLLLKP